MSNRAKSQATIIGTTAIISVLLGVCITLGVGYLFKDQAGAGDQSEHITDGMGEEDGSFVESSDDILYWTCGMHPSIRSDEPGKCPICFMDLVPISAASQDGGDADDILARLEITEQGRALAMIDTVPVTYRRLEHVINTTGRLALDERKVTHMHSRIGGWIDEVFVEFTGVDVEAGQPLVAIYSEELVTAQEEFLLAVQGANQMAENSSERLRESSVTLLESARLRLKRWDITDGQIDELERTGEPQENLIIYYDAPSDTPEGGVVVERVAVEGMRVNRGDRLYTIADLSTLWIMADVYEYEMAWVNLGQQVEVTSRAYPGIIFQGEIAFIEPTLDPVSRSVRVRVDVANPEMDLKPEMWVDARIRIPLDQSNELLNRLRESAQRQWSERWENSEPLEVLPQESTSQPQDHSTHIPDDPYICAMLCEGGVSDEAGQHCPVCGMIMLPRDEIVAMHADMVPSSQPASHPTSQPTSQPVPQGMTLVVPDVSVLRTGQREVVYVEEEPGVYTGREVIVGPTGHVVIEGQRELYVPVLAGLEPGMRVVTRGNFLLDSQTTLTGGAAAAYGSALDSSDDAPMPPGHQH